jgi:phage baseplate assembly protein W
MSVDTTTNSVNLSRNEIIYKDLGISFQSHPVTKKLTVLKNENAVKRAIKNLILTNKGEKFFRPLYGGNINSYLFENFTRVTEIDVRRDIINAIETYEPRATVLDVIVNAREDQNTLRVTIIFSIKDSRTPVELSFNVERIR